MRRLLALLAGSALAVLLAVCATAQADIFGGISLVSESPGQQAEYAHDPAMSANGRYVVFDGSYGGVTGVWRRDQQTRAVEQVAGGDAELPSISESGRYVSFTTTATLSTNDHNAGPDVYVRDMSLEASQPGAFTLASAVNGSEEGLSYQASSEPASYGSLAAGRSALSGDGRKVVFVTTARSDLIGKRPPEAPETPALQVAVRNLDTKSTQLVSATYTASEEPKAVSAQEGASTFGAVYAPGGQGSPPPFRAIEAYAARAAFGASISADGSTVAWLGQNVGQQAPGYPGEQALPPRYAEPLWRRIADGPLAPTRRMASGSQGPFATFKEPNTPGTWTGGVGDVIPRLSADGYTAAFLANAALVSFGSGFGNPEHASDLYVVDMHAGGVRPLTELASGEDSDLATTAPIVDLGISPDGSQVAFTTKRTVFPLGSPAYVSAPAAAPGMVELFAVDLANDTLTRVTRGFEGGASEHPHKPKPAGEDPYNQTNDGALSPSFAGDGNTIAFSSTASNLVYGDGNTPPLEHESKVFDGSDAFVVSREVFASAATEGYVSSPPANPALVPAWRLDGTAFSRPDGTVLVEVEVPGAGTLHTGADAVVQVQPARPARTSRRSKSRRKHTRATIAIRTVASRGVEAPGGGLVVLTLKLSSRYAVLASKRGGLSATVKLIFTASGQPTLHESLTATFLRTARAARPPRPSASRNVHRHVHRHGGHR
jgi:WD40-like Beta Propeller Repeat